MPEWLSRSAAAIITLLIVSIGGIMSFARMESQIQQLDNRVTRLENQQDNMVEVLNRLDKRIALLLCKTDPTACLER